MDPLMGLYWVGNLLANALVDGFGTMLVDPKQEINLVLIQTPIFST